MDFPLSKELPPPYLTVSIFCEGDLGKVLLTQKNVPPFLLDQFVNQRVDKLSDQYRIHKCVTTHISQTAFDEKESYDFKYIPNDHAKSLMDTNKLINRKITVNRSVGFNILGTFGITFLAGVFAYQTAQTVIQFQQKRPEKGLKHGLVATISLIMLVIFGNTLSKL